MKFIETKRQVANRGCAPDAFLTTLVTWGRSAPAEIFAKNDSPRDIYAAVAGELGPYTSDEQRRAVMLEVMRVHAGYESTWNWNEGVDVTNRRSVVHIEGQETGIFQVSYDSVMLGTSVKLFAHIRGIDTPQKFIAAMKLDHALALEYYARLVRVSIAWAGPLKKGLVNDWVRPGAVNEFASLLVAQA